MTSGHVPILLKGLHLRPIPDFHPVGGSSQFEKFCRISTKQKIVAGYLWIHRLHTNWSKLTTVWFDCGGNICFSRLMKDLRFDSTSRVIFTEFWDSRRSSVVSILFWLVKSFSIRVDALGVRDGVDRHGRNALDFFSLSISTTSVKPDDCLVMGSIFLFKRKYSELLEFYK